MTNPEGSLTPAELRRLEAIRSAESLSTLAEITGVESEHDAYFEAKSIWRELRRKELATEPEPEGLPGDTLTISGQRFTVHGVTHANTTEERQYLRTHVQSFLENNRSVYCEQGIRRMYFEDWPAVCEIDDYNWAMHHCQKRGLNSHVEGHGDGGFDGFTEDITSIASRFREAAFSLIESGSDVYGDRFAAALGDVASDFLMSHEEIGTAEDFASFSKSQQAATNPEKLGELQRYYKCNLLPQPLEREWLRRHDPELELFTHARNERLAEYAIYHSSDNPVHLIVGAAHQPGVLYYLKEFSEGSRDLSSFEFVD